MAEHGLARQQFIDGLKAKLKATWMDGNYDYFSRFMASSAPEFLDRIDPAPGASFLDVACGSGQLALAAAERGLRVTGADIATNLVAAARSRAASPKAANSAREKEFSMAFHSGGHCTASTGAPGSSTPSIWPSLARALTKAGPGDTVVLRAPGGTEHLEVVEVRYERIHIDAFSEPPGAETAHHEADAFRRWPSPGV